MFASIWKSSCLNAATMSGTEDKGQAHEDDWEWGIISHAKYKATASNGLQKAGSFLGELMSSATNLAALLAGD